MVLVVENRSIGWDRYYDPRTGRFLSPDPVGFFDPRKKFRNNVIGIRKPSIEPNHYRYVFSNPVKYSDPTGRWPEWLDDGVCGITGKCNPADPDSPDWWDTIDDVIDDIFPDDEGGPNSCTSL